MSHVPSNHLYYLEKKPAKYRNRKTLYMGINFDSQKEADRYRDLLLIERAGEIRNIECHARYDLVVNGQNIGFYKADFRYEVVVTGAVVVEDVKCRITKTPVYQLKKKLMKALYDIEIVEVF